jgi:nitronate monooxygenase
MPYDEYAQAIAEGGVKVVETAGRSPEQFIPMFKENGIKVIHKCTAIRHALTAQRIGCDAVSVDGVECAGHPGEDDVTNFILLPLAAKALDIPFLASGGIGDGRGMAAAMALGADGINMGTRFMATLEAPVHDNVKQAMVAGTERDTAHIFRSLRNTARVYKNSVAKQVLEIEARPGDTDFNDLKDLVSGAKGRKVFETGDMEHGIWTAGMVMGMIDSSPTCDELVQSIARECEEIIKSRLVGMYP